MLFKRNYILFFLVLYIQVNLYSQNMNYAEIAIINQSNGPINAFLTPVGTIFSGRRINTGGYPENRYRYTFVRSREDVSPSGGWKYLIGSYNNYTNIPNNGIRYVDFDDGTYCTLETLLMWGISYGLWHLKITDAPEDDTDPHLIDECWIDYRDLNYGSYGNNMTNDIIFYVKDINNDKQLWFKFAGGSEIEVNNTVFIQNKHIKVWHQVGKPGDPLFPGSPNLGNFKTTNYSSSTGLNFLDFPIIGTSNPLNAILHESNNELYMNLSIIAGHNAKIRENYNLIISNNATLNILYGGILNLQSNSILTIKSGSGFCNYGEIRGINPLVSSIRWEKGGRFKVCNGTQSPYKNIHFLAEDSTIVEFPDSTTLVFDSTAIFSMMPHSELRMGKHSKIIFQNGSRINCNNAKITSLDSTQTWDGIYLSDDANDTLINCVIQNAYNGINITQPTSIGLTEYSTVINNCTFKNTTSTKLLNQVYIDGADDILIKDCSTESGISSGFASCIVMQYCPSGSVVIADNSFSNCDIGITAIQSSPYIARNTITGLTGSGTGLYLDNSNGTIEYNTVNNFERSLECGYSSPYLLKNSFNDASDIIIQMYSASVPVMRPVNSGSVTRWLGGNNILAGMPGSGAMVLEKESYPMMDSGYNLISVNGYNYISGDLDGDLEATMNYWFDSPPISSFFDVSGGEVIYDPLFNGSSLPNMDYFELNSIGFGMYDSVFVIDNGDNPLAGSLFMQAYSNEMQGNYSTAISKYKDVVSEYKTSTYATVSLARIFNCLEKYNGSVTDYSNIQSYYAGIKNDTNNTKESREISEDFVIKSKVRQGNIMEAVSDYDNIYQNNQNTHKGTHALLNKLCLLKYGAGGDNPNIGSGTESKINILSLIGGKSLSQNISSNSNNTPRSFKLHQNYPNPFNPVTNIKYEIPNDANVSIKIYDLLGREVFSNSEFKLAGSYEMVFDGSDLASGLYFYTVKAETSQRDVYTETKKMVLIK